ncbi:hypothetical protein TSUD_361010, partial [Trifolium subterraneum]
LQASTDQELNHEIPHFNLPSKLLCRVVNVHLLAEQETDEVYACVSLIPESDLSDPVDPDPIPSESPKQKFHSFCKILTASDTSTHGGFSVLRKHATECLPPLDMTQATPSQELVAKDLHGFEWKFKHIYRGQPRRHLLTTGWSTFVASKRLVAGDAFVFLRGEDGQLRVGVRRMAKQHCPMPSSVISSQCMHLGLLATASHAVMTHTMFSVYYKPRTSQFIVGLNKYLAAVNNYKFSVGMRFKMRFEGDDSPERRFNGMNQQQFQDQRELLAEGIWPNSPHLNITSNPYANINIASRPINGPTFDHRVEDTNKTPNPLDCWLFGVNLNKNNKCNNVNPCFEKEHGFPNLSIGTTSGPKESILTNAACETEKVQSPNNSLSTIGQQKKIICDVSTNERQNKLATVPSKRKRTKE